MRAKSEIPFRKKLPSVLTLEIDRNLLEIAYRIPAGTLCLSTALARHGLTDNIPARIDVAIPRGNRIPVLQTPVGGKLPITLRLVSRIDPGNAAVNHTSLIGQGRAMDCRHAWRAWRR